MAMQAMIRKFLALEAAGGLVLFFAAIFAMLWVNSSFAPIHQQLADKYTFFINDGLMSLFFLVVGLELRRGYDSGQYANKAQMLLPALAALGGMIVPALVYVAVNHADSTAWRGWATPVATDIAFAVGVLSLCGKRIPAGLRLFLLALAIFDDIGAILIIALFYSHGIALSYLLGVAVILLVLYLLRRLRIKKMTPYLLLGAALWYVLLNAGVHPTIGGVLFAFFVPDDNSLEQELHPWVTLLVIPLFALANAGFPLEGMVDQLSSTVVLGIILGLFVGKQIGVFGTAWLLIRLKFASMPGKCSWTALYGVSLLCGIGFTMSLFLGTLSFQGDSLRLVDVRLGVLIGSVMSGIVGALVLLGRRNHIEHAN